MLYRILPFGLAPIILTVLSIGIGYFASWWALAAIPFVWLGALFSVPSMNLVDGCFCYISMAIGLILSAFHKPFGYAMLTGAVSGYYLSWLEKMIYYSRQNNDGS